MNPKEGRLTLTCPSLNMSIADQASISLNSLLRNLKFAHFGGVCPDEHEHTKNEIMPCLATHAAP
jgi:hypothetical protein